MKTQYLFVICLTLLLPLSALAQEDRRKPGVAPAAAAPSAAAEPAAAAPSAVVEPASHSRPAAPLTPAEAPAQASPTADGKQLPAASLPHEGALLNDLSPEVVKKLDAKQLEKLIRHRASVQAKSSRGDHSLVSVLVPIFFFFCLSAVAGASLLYRHRQNGHRHQTLRLMIDKGAEIPPELLSPPVKPRSDLRRGILLLAAGVGVMIFLALVSAGDSPQRLWSLGLIPSLVGVGYLVVWKLESKRDTVA